MFLKKNSIKFCILILTLSSPEGFAQQELIPVNGTLFGYPLQTGVDHELAKTMLTNPNDQTVAKLFSDYQNHEVSTETLTAITAQYSADVSSLFFAERLYQQEKNRLAQNHYLASIDTLFAENIEQHLSFLKDYYIVFVPGFRYKLVDNGGNFSKQRKLFDSAGISYEMVEIDEAGLVKDNAEIIAKRLQELNKIKKNIIVISVSKGGLEAAIALDKLSKTHDYSSIIAWINVGGILKGTPVADEWLPPFRRFWMNCGLLFIGQQRVKLKQLLTDLSYNRCKETYKNLKIPTEITTVSLVAVPLGEREEQAENFPVPNDRFSPLADIIIEDGVTIMEMCSDHFFKNVELNSRMAAILHYIVTLQNQPNTRL